MSDPTRKPDPEEEFFVGYLDTPPRTKRFALGTGVFVIALALGMASAAAFFQRSPGEALERSTRGELTGLWLQQPYPHLRYVDEETGQLRHALTARGWKAGLGDSYEELDDQMVTVGGQLFRRTHGGLLVVFQAPEASDAAPSSEDEARLRSVASDVGATVDLTGEIVDSKCFYGQMRPGDGRAHRACAQLCVRGGIAPVFVTRTREGQETHYWLTTETGGPAQNEALEYMAEPVRIHGEVERRGELAILRASSITRL